MEFRLTYEGPLYAHQDSKKLLHRNDHVHDIRKQFHKQLKLLWEQHPILKSLKDAPAEYHLPPHPPVYQIFEREGFNFLPIVHSANGLICKVDILLLRPKAPGDILIDLDNRLKTVFDALRMIAHPEVVPLPGTAG